MSPTRVLSSRIRALSVISISASLVTTVSVWASRQQAVSPLGFAGSHAATVAFLSPDKGAITPDASGIQTMLRKPRSITPAMISG